MLKPDFILDIPAHEYHDATKRNEYVTSHRLAVFRKCPLEYKQRTDGTIVEKDTEAFTLGSATHTLILEGPTKFNEEYVVSDGPINEKTGKPYGKTTQKYVDWLAEQTKPVISGADCDMIEAMRKAVRSHPVASKLLAEGFAEGTVRTAYNGVPVQCRMDWFNPETGDLVDLKTCADIDRFRWDIRDFGYVHQLAFYTKLLKLAGYDKPINCYLVAVEKKQPYRVAVVNVVAVTIGSHIEMHTDKDGCYRDDCDAMIEDLKICADTNTWPTRFEDVIIL